MKSNIPVMGHIGYTQQFKNKFLIEGDTEKKLDTFKVAISIEKAGAFSIVIECVAPNASKLITSKLKIQL